MAAVFCAGGATSRPSLTKHNAASAGIDVSVAVDNGAQQVISGPAGAVEAILERFESDGIRVARLRRSPAYHSAMIEPALDGLEASIRDIPFAPPTITLLSNVTGAAVAPERDPRCRLLAAAHARERVRFRSCVEELASLGVDAVLELGPHAVLGPMTALAWPGSAGEPPAVVCESHAAPRGHARPPTPRTRSCCRPRRGVRSRHSRAARGAVRRRIAPPGFLAGLSVPARTLLGVEEASPGRRRPPAAREPARLGTRRNGLRHRDSSHRSGVAGRSPSLRPSRRTGRALRCHGGLRGLGGGPEFRADRGLPAPEPPRSQ